MHGLQHFLSFYWRLVRRVRGPRRNGDHKGFTLIELMVVVAVLGILAALALPMFGELLVKAQESVTKGNLGTLRSALAIYYGDTEGRFPLSNPSAALTASSKYLTKIPGAYYPRTFNNNGHVTVNIIFETVGSPGNGVSFTESLTGGQFPSAWIYDDGPTTNTYGNIICSCSHGDLRGQSWSSY